MKRIKKFSKRIFQRQNITAISMIIAIGGIACSLALAAAAYSRQKALKMEKGARHSAYEDELRRLSGITTNLKPVSDPTASWKVFEEKKYNFLIKYPNDWQEPVQKSPSGEEKFLSRITFEKQSLPEKSAGAFDVYIYSGANLDFSDAGHLLKKSNSPSAEECPRFDEITLGGGGYPAKEVNVAASNPCWRETFFYSITKNDFTYVILPRLGSSYDIENFEEGMSFAKFNPLFFDIISTLDLTKEDIVSRVVKKIAAPPKVRFSPGRKCAHPERKPRYSPNKGKHMDEDCCPDPDEWPNPACSYSAKDLSIMISPPAAKKKK